MWSLARSQGQNWHWTAQKLYCTGDGYVTVAVIWSMRIAWRLLGSDWQDDSTTATCQDQTGSLRALEWRFNNPQLSFTDNNCMVRRSILIMHAKPYQENKKEKKKSWPISPISAGSVRKSNLKKKKEWSKILKWASTFPFPLYSDSRKITIKNLKKESNH